MTWWRASFARRRQRPVAGGLHLPAHVGGLAVPRGGAGRLQSPDRRLVDGRSHAHRTRLRCVDDGRQPPPAGARAGPSLRSGRAIRLVGVRPGVRQVGDRAVDGIHRRLLGITRWLRRSSRRSRRSWSTDPCGRPAASSSARSSSTSKRLQPPAPALYPRLPLAHGVRGGPRRSVVSDGR